MKLITAKHLKRMYGGGVDMYINRYNTENVYVCLCMYNIYKIYRILIYIFIYIFIHIDM